jgi:hypothetical protein
MEEYDKYTNEQLPQKIPVVERPIRKLEVGSNEWKLRLGDSIYDFSRKGIPQREGVHRRANRRTDMKGKNALLSWEFVYFGHEATELPSELDGILHQGQGFRSRKNEKCVDIFLKWWELNRPAYDNDRIRGMPQWDVSSDPETITRCAMVHRNEDENDKET